MFVNIFVYYLHLVCFFLQVIEYVTAYKPLLTAIKKEYEVTIESIRKGQREADYLNGKLKAMASEPSTIRNYKKRADELEERYISNDAKQGYFLQHDFNRLLMQ